MGKYPDVDVAVMRIGANHLPVAELAADLYVLGN